MDSQEKILKVLETIKGKVDIAPADSVLDYRAGHESSEIGVEDEILILNKLASEGVIEVIDNYSSEYV